MKRYTATLANNCMITYEITERLADGAA